MPNHPYTREYFDDGTTGYHMFRDFPVHYRTIEIIMKRKPESVLEVGAARGYLVRKLEVKGIRAVAMDISEHCRDTRATDSFVLHDATVAPWPFKDKEFDLAVSISFLEHIPEDKLDVVLGEMARVSNRGLHGIGFTSAPTDIDKTHRTMRSQEWWIERFKSAAPNWETEILDKEEVESGVIMLPRRDDMVKLNIGSFTDCFHYGWENIDILDISKWAAENGYIFKQVDVTKGIPKPDNSVDIILASHLMEHFAREQGLAFLEECSRVLKPNGLIRLAVPDTRLLTEKYLKGEIMEYRYVNVGVERAKDDAEALFSLLLAGHQTVYDEDSLKRLLKDTGFIGIKRMPAFESQSEVIRKQTIPCHCTVSLYMEAKPSLKSVNMRKQWILDQCKTGERILDIGSADGHIFRDSGRNMTHIDIDKYDLPNFVQMDAHELKFQDKSFDIAVLGELLEHVNDPVKVLHEAKRVAHKLVITVPDEENWAPENYPYETPEKAILRLGLKDRLEFANMASPNAISFNTDDNLAHLWHRRHYTKKTLEENLKKAGLEYRIEQLQYSGWSFFCVIANETPLYKQYLNGKISEGRQPLNT